MQLFDGVDINHIRDGANGPRVRRAKSNTSSRNGKQFSVDRKNTD
jgi:hypothetical protein